MSTNKSKTWLNRYSKDLNNLTFLEHNEKVREYYLKISKIQHVEPIIIIAEEVSFVSLLSSHVSFVVDDNLCVDPIRLSRNIFITGLPGSRKDVAGHMHRKRLIQLFQKQKISFENYEKKKKKLRVTELICGYIRRIQKKIDWIIPEIIVEVCMNTYCRFYFAEFESKMNTIDCIEQLHKPNASYDFSWDHKVQAQCCRQWMIDPFKYPFLNDLYADLIARNGWMQLQISSLKDTIGFFESQQQSLPKLLDQFHQGRMQHTNYTLRNLNCHVWAICRPRTLMKLFETTPHMKSKILIFPVSTFDSTSDNEICYGRQDKIDCDMRLYDMDWIFWDFLMLKDQNMPTIKYETYYNEQMPTIIICKELQSDLVEVSQTKESLARVLTLAFVFTIRNQMLKAMKCYTSDAHDNGKSLFHWDLQIDSHTIQAAMKLVQLLDGFADTLTEIEE